MIGILLEKEFKEAGRFCNKYGKNTIDVEEVVLSYTFFKSLQS